MAGHAELLANTRACGRIKFDTPHVEEGAVAIGDVVNNLISAQRGLSTRRFGSVIGVHLPPADETTPRTDAPP